MNTDDFFEENFEGVFLTLLVHFLITQTSDEVPISALSS